MSFQTNMNFFSVLQTKDDILKNVGNQIVAGSHWLFIVWNKILWNSMAAVNCLVTNIVHNIFFCVQQKKETYTGLNKH